MTQRNSKGQFAVNTPADTTISLRDLIAIEAMKVLLVGNEDEVNWCTERSYQVADSMLYARSV